MLSEGYEGESKLKYYRCPLYVGIMFFHRLVSDGPSSLMWAEVAIHDDRDRSEREGLSADLCEHYLGEKLKRGNSNIHKEYL